MNFKIGNRNQLIKKLFCNFLLRDAIKFKKKLKMAKLQYYKIKSFLIFNKFYGEERKSWR